MDTRRLWILGFSLVLLGTVFAQEASIDHYKEGQRLFGEQDFAGAMEEFQKADALVPDDATINSWIGACLNALGRYAEAKQRVQTAFKLLEDQRHLLSSKAQLAPPIDLAYYSLLAGIQVNLREFEDAVRTINSYNIPDPKSEDAAKQKEAFDAAKKNVYSQLVSAGVQCLSSDDLECARMALTQADLLDPEPPSVVEAIAKEALVRAARAPASTDEEKAKKAELYAMAIHAGRLWVSVAGPESTDAQRVLVKALMGARTERGYDEARQILTSLWDASVDSVPRDASIQLDLAAAYTGLEEWDLAVAAASTAIANSPDDPLGEGYCKRSYAQYRLGQCQEAVEDGQRCKNPDGTPRTLRHVDICNQRLADLQARVAADRESTLKRECGYLQDRVKWAIESGDLALDDLVQVIRDFKASEAKCEPYFEAPVGPGSGAALCAAGVNTASFPLNLSARSREELEQLRSQIQDFSGLCKPALDATQIAGVNSGLQKVDQALSMYR